MSTFVGERVEVCDGIAIEWCVKHGELTPKTIWETKDVWHNQLQESKEIWSKMTTEQREATIRVTKNGMARLYDKVEEWLPEGLEARSGAYMDVYFRILYTDLDKEMQQNDMVTSFKVRDALEGTKEILNDLGVVLED
jgi:hypothetical protein